MGIGKVLAVWVVAIYVVLGMCGGALAMDHEVQTKSKAGVGKYLADAKGMTLYWFKNDSPGKSACAGPCVENWPVFFRETVRAAEGLKDGDFGAMTRADGKKQSTFRGYPLYYWKGDKAPGDTGGQGMNNVWYVIDPAVFPPKM